MVSPHRRIPLLCLALTLGLWFSVGGAGHQAQAQSIRRNDQPRFIVDQYDAEQEDGQLMLTFGVSMSDCIEKVEVENLANHRKYLLRPTLDDYFVRDNDMEEIYAKLPIGPFKKHVDRKKGLYAMVVITSKTGRRVYSAVTRLHLDKQRNEERSEGAAPVLTAEQINRFKQAPPSEEVAKQTTETPATGTPTTPKPKPKPKKGYSGDE